MSNNIITILVWLPIAIVIGTQISFLFIYKDIEIIIRRAIKNAIKDIRREYE